MTVSAVIEAVGREALARELGVSDFSIKAALQKQQFPAKWWSVVQRLAKAEGVEAPEGLFNFIPSERDHGGPRDLVISSSVAGETEDGDAIDECHVQSVARGAA